MFVEWLLLILLFLLPWQTRFIWQQGQINGAPWEYGTYSIYGTEIIFWLAAIFLLINLWRQQELKVMWKRKSLRVYGFTSLLVVFLFLAIIRSLSSEISFQYVFHLLEGLALVSAIYILSRTNKLFTLKLLNFLWLGGVLQGLLALYQFLTQFISANKWLGMAAQNPRDLGVAVIEFGDERWLRAYGSFGWPNSLGIYLAVCLVAGLLVYGFTGLSVWKRIFVSVGQVIITMGLVLSFSRSAWLGVTVGLVSLLIVVLSSRAKSRDPLKSDFKGFLHSLRSVEMTSVIKQLFFILAPAICLFFIFQPLFLTRFDLQERLENRSVTERLGQYAEFQKIFSTHPWLGVGPGVYTLALSEMYPKAKAYELQPVHNIYLLFLAEWGIVGAVLWLVVYGFMSLRVWRYNKKWVPIILVLLVAGLFDHWSYTLYTGMMLWWVVWGLSLASPKEA